MFCIGASEILIIPNYFGILVKYSPIQNVALGVFQKVKRSLVVISLLLPSVLRNELLKRAVGLVRGPQVGAGLGGISS